MAPVCSGAIYEQTLRTQQVLSKRGEFSLFPRPQKIFHVRDFRVFRNEPDASDGRDQPRIDFGFSRKIS